MTDLKAQCQPVYPDVVKRRSPMLNGKPTFGPQDWVVLRDGEPQTGASLFRLATPADFDAAIERREKEISELRKARQECEDRTDLETFLR